MSGALREPTMSGKIGQAARATVKMVLATPFGLAEDILEPAVRALTPVTTGAANAVATAVTGDSRPMFQDGAVPPLRPPAPASLRTPQAIAPASAPVEPQDGVLTRKGNSFSGSNISGLGRNTIPGMDQSVIDQTLTNPDGSRWSASDNAIMAANLRDGVNKYRGTSRDTGDDQMASLRAKAMDSNAIGHNGAAKLLATLQGDATARRGQDIGLEGQMLGAKGSMARLRYDMSKDQRDFAAGRSDKNFEQQQAGKKAIDDQIEKMFIDKEGKPDLAQAAEYKQFMTNGIANQVKVLSESNDPAMRAAAAKLQGRSYADLDDADRQALHQLWMTRDASKKASGWMPGTGNHVDSLNPQDFAVKGVDPRTFGADHVVTNNGSHISKNDLTGKSWYMPIKRTSAFDETLRRADATQR